MNVTNVLVIIYLTNTKQDVIGIGNMLFIILV